MAHNRRVRSALQVLLHILWKRRAAHTATLSEIKCVLRSCLSTCRDLYRLPYFYIIKVDSVLGSHFWELDKIFRDRDILFTIMGNLFHIDNEVCGGMHSPRCEKYQLPINNLKDTHDVILCSGSFDETLKAIGPIRMVGIRYAIIIIVFHDNAVELFGTVNVVVNNEANVFAFASH